jgi:predicted permease
MAIVEIIFPVFAIALLGYIVAYKGLFTVRDIQGISRFVFIIAIPVMLFNSLAHIDLPEHLNWQFLVSYYAIALFIFGLGMWASKSWFAHSAQEQSVFGLGSSYSNSVLVGLPLVSAGLGDEALLPTFMLIAIHSALLFFMPPIRSSSAWRWVCSSTSSISPSPRSATAPSASSAGRRCPARSSSWAHR